MTFEDAQVCDEMFFDKISTEKIAYKFKNHQLCLKSKEISIAYGIEDYYKWQNIYFNIKPHYGDGNNRTEVNEWINDLSVERL